MFQYEKFRLSRRSKVEFKGPSATYVHAGKIKTRVSIRTPLHFWPNMWLVPKTKITNLLSVLLNILTTKYNFHWQVDLI